MVSLRRCCCVGPDRPGGSVLPTQKRRMVVVCVLVGIAAQYLLQALSWLWVSLLALLPGHGRAKRRRHAAKHP